MAFRTTKSVDMINGSLKWKIFNFAATFMLTSFLQHLYNAADIIVVGRYAGHEALAGVGACTTIVGLFLNFILGLSAGATIVLGQAIGSGNRDDISKTSHTAIAVAVWGGLIVSVLSFLFAKPLLRMTDVPLDIMPEALSYLRVRSIGFIPALIYNFGSGILRAKGDVNRALYIVTVSGIFNVLLNLFFVCCCGMKASGVALATVISQIFTAVCILHILCRESDETRIYLLKVRAYKTPFLKILRFGLPSGIQSSVYSISNVVVQSSVNSFGAATIAGSAATSSITEFYSIMMNSLYQAALVFASQNYGAKKFERIKKVLYICIVYVGAVWAIQSLVTYYGGEFLVGLYTKNDIEVTKIALRKLNVVGYAYGLLGLLNVMSGMLRGMGASFVNMLTSVVGVCGIRIIWIMTAFKAIGTFEALFLCYPISWAGTFIMHTIMFVIIFKRERAIFNSKTNTAVENFNL